MTPNIPAPTTKAKQRVWVDWMIAEAGTPAPRHDVILAMLVTLRGQLRNRAPQTRGEISAAPLTDEVIAEIWRLHTAYPTMTQQDIANRTGTNIGRVSGVLAGIRQ